MLPIIDTHQHLWDLQKFNLPWLEGIDVLDKPHLMSDYLDATKDANVVKTVYMEVDVTPSQRIAEAEYVIELCKRDDNPMCGAVISLDPTADDFKKNLDRFKDIPYIKGIRRVLHVLDAASGYCYDKTFIEGMQLLGEYGLSFDICIRPAELSDAVKLVEQCPNTQFILDHCGNADPKVINGANPGPQNEGDWSWHTREQWQQDMADLADHSNVVCKVSGIVARAPQDWRAAHLASAINYCIDTFGPDRVIFGGDWPVCTLTATYQEWATALREIIKDRSEADQQKLLHDNAMQLYGLV